MEKELPILTPFDVSRALPQDCILSKGRKMSLRLITIDETAETIGEEISFFDFQYQTKSPSHFPLRCVFVLGKEKRKQKVVLAPKNVPHPLVQHLKNNRQERKFPLSN
ncbi:uncharacterized protein PV06_08622 [Exophiala oligosperma]|uniref:Uncharacterized protein n=1 Tax=Exophiala oligosperma TaxID=215243 RepID=A0A0D2D6F8_9EURO|nr:uncharacterized protein PV06_08622 [Exophiala oligosperma]KIW38783.1 hypothetical protein PV06_08622 [Exophiala oligosperma]